MALALQQSSGFDARAGARRSALTRLAPIALILVAAAVIWAPNLAIRAPGDSFGYDLEWSSQFSRLFLAGDVYPRWMPASFDGLGSPAFYFYPPLPFWVTALVAGATGGLVSAAMQLKLAGLILFAASGCTMYAWLRAAATPARALIGAILFMAAPYHFDDYYQRGDLAEFAAFACIPLAALGLRQTAQGLRRGPLVLALGYAGLILAHLPVALLTSVLAIGPYAAFLTWRASGRRLRVAAAIAAALSLGIGLAAISLAPALSLQGAISAEYWWSSKFHPGDGVLTNPHAWSSGLLVLLAVTALAEGALALIVVLCGRRANAEMLFWTVVCLGVLAFFVGLWPGFWSLPLISKVQFPWRAMALQEFALVTVLALAPTLTAPRLAALGAALVVINPAFLATAYQLMPRAAAPAGPPPAAAYTPEYLPAGMVRIVGGAPAPAVALEQLAQLPLAAGPALSAPPAADPVTGAVSLAVAPGAHGQLTLRRFYFPSWRASCDGHPIAVAPTGAARLVGFVAPTGAARCEAHIGVSPPETLGAVVAALSLLLLALYGVWAVAAGRSTRKSVAA